MLNLAINFRYLEPHPLEAPVGFSCPHPRTCAFMAAVPEIIFLISASVLLALGYNDLGTGLMVLGGVFLTGDTIAALIGYVWRTAGDREAAALAEREQLLSGYPVKFAEYPNTTGTAIDLDSDHPMTHVHHVHYTAMPNTGAGSSYFNRPNPSESRPRLQDGECYFAFKPNLDDRYCLRNVLLTVCEDGHTTTYENWLDCPRNFRQEIIDGRLKAPASLAHIKERFPAK